MATLRGRSSAYQPVLIEPGDAHLAQLAVFAERTEGRASVDALELVDFGASVSLTVVDADVDVDRVGGGLDARAKVGRSRKQSQALREERSEHAVAVDRLLVGQPGHLVQAEHDRHVVIHLDVERGVFQPQRQVPVEAGVGCRSHIRREPDLDAVRQSRLDVQVAAGDVERVVAVLLVQFGGVLQKRDDAERHGGIVRGGGIGCGVRSGLGQRPASQAQHHERRQTESIHDLHCKS